MAKDLRSSDVKDLESPASATGNELVPAELNGRDVYLTAQMIANLGGGGGTVSSVDGRTGAVTLSDLYDASGAAATAQANAIAASQPLDSDLTAIAALTTQTFGRARLTDTDAATAKAALAIAESDVANLTSDLALKAPLASPALTGTPTAPTPSTFDNSTKLATTAYVDAAQIALGDKPDVAYASTSALPANTYANGSSGVGATLTGNVNGPLVIDGVTLVVGQAGERVLVAGEAAPANDGWYTITQVGVVAVSPYILTRATESDQAAEIGAGYLTRVIAPNTVVAGANNGKVFISVAADPFTVGTTSLTFSQVGGTYTNGNGISLSGSTFSIDTSVTVDKTTAQTLTNKSISGSQINSGTVPIAQIPTGTDGTHVPLGGVITGAGPTGDASHTLALTYNAAGQLTAVTNNAIAIAESAVTNLVSDLALKAPLASPTFTGVVSLPLGESADTAPIGSLVTRHGGVYVGKRALDKWRYTKQVYRTVAVISDSLGQGNVGGLDPWPERLARDLGNWNGPRLTSGPGFYGLYRSGSLIFGSGNGDREWIPWGTWSTVAATTNYDLAPYSSTLICTNANATALRTTSDGVSTLNSVTYTSASMAFVAGDVGALITGTNIPPNTYIQIVNSGTSVNLTNRCTASGTTLSVSIHGAILAWNRPLGNNACRKMFDATTATNTTLVCPSANFHVLDIGKMVTGGNIPANTTLSGITDYQTATLSQAATGSAVGGNLIIHDGRVVNDAVTATNTTLTSATAAFVTSDVGSKVIGTNIPAGTYISSVQSPTSVTLSAATTGTGSALFLFIQTYQAARFVNDMVSSAGTGTITSATAAFTQQDVGRHVIGTSIGANTTITAVTNSTTATISNNIATTNTGGNLMIGSTFPISVVAFDLHWTDGIASNGASFGYSVDGGTTWTAVTQTASGGPLSQRTTITPATANPASLIIRANVGTSTTSAAKSQTIQNGISVYQATPRTAGFNLYNMSRDGFMLANAIHGGIGDSMNFLDNGQGGTFPGWRPDLIIVLFSNDQLNSTNTAWQNNLNRLIDRTQSYADVVLIGTYQMGDARTLATTQAFNASMKALINATTTSWAVTDGVTNSSTTITSATMAFEQQDVGRTITGTDIPGATTITAVASATSATISNTASGSHSGDTFTITGTAPDDGNAFMDMYEAYSAEGVTGYTAANTDGLMFDTVHPSQMGHNEIGGRISRLIRVFS